MPIYLIEFSDPELEDGKITILIKSKHDRNTVYRTAYEIQEEYDKVAGEHEDVEESLEWLKNELKEKLKDVKILNFEYIDAPRGWIYG